MDEGDEQDVVVKWTSCEGTQPFLWLHFEASLQGQQEQDLILITLTLSIVLIIFSFMYFILLGLY